MKSWKVYATAVATVLTLAACSDEQVTEDAPVDYAQDVTEKPVVTITMENDAQIIVELDPTIAPNTVANFIALAEDDFYDGTTFHRVIPDFMIQGGDPEGTGMGGPDYAIEGEFTNNGFDNELKHERGVISMARSNDPDSAGSQFFIMTADAESLDGEYASFGHVLEGMDVVDAIVNTPRDERDKPLEAQVMKTVEVDTKGFDYPEPVKK
ncbi:peptidylprolyl isomerase [Caryophanon tenue]|uniref:Peptidyl-prolyl cis-trans isomerase n=1 Tax=Caryophanon tenue TaxID=33978 RepID=A0A1C0YCY5_9BACL|nr:peptidylprolyl isomerase [Caryophanon tenue]OCS85046.1 peptidylprolyl isomerase [Caryophanon tenue]